MPCQLWIQVCERDQAKASTPHFWNVFFLEWAGKKLSVLSLWYVTKISLEDFSSWKFREEELVSELKCKSKQHSLKWGIQHKTKISIHHYDIDATIILLPLLESEVENNQNFIISWCYAVHNLSNGHQLTKF